jgi:2-iminobutanoate/2-iminopropanoate deaminase
MNQTFGPYTPIRRAGATYFVSGQVGVNPKDKTAPPDVAGQTERALLNLEAVLATEGLTLNDVVKTTIFVTDMGAFAEVNAVYEQRFDTPRPARSTVGVKELPRVGGGTDLLVEIEAVAYKEPS